MGLDITHYKATLEKAENHTLFYIGNDIYGETGAEIRDKFKGFNVDFDHFRKYIQQVDVPQEVETVILVKGIENLEKVKAHFQSTEKTFLVKENEESLKRKLIEFEKKKSYQHLEKSFEDIQQLNWIILKYYTVEKKEGFYFKSVGYQRKGMNGSFGERFYKTEASNFALKEDFEYALSCLDYYWESDTEEALKLRKEEFKKGFIDNFELGASFMSLSY